VKTRNAVNRALLVVRVERIFRISDNSIYCKLHQKYLSGFLANRALELGNPIYWSGLNLNLLLLRMISVNEVALKILHLFYP